MKKFSLKIDDAEGSLNSERGISIDIIGKLLEDLYSAIDLNSRANCTLSSIRGNCYALDFSTESETHLERFKIVHRKIEEVGITDLDAQERKYAKTLKKIISDRYFIKAYDENKNEIASINRIKNDDEIKYYFSHKTIYGFVSELGGKSLESTKKHILIDGYPFRIYISKDLDLQLKQYYRTQKLAVKLRLKHSFESGNIINSEMINFKVVESKSLMDNLKQEGYVPLKILNNNTCTLEGIIDALYGNS